MNDFTHKVRILARLEVMLLRINAQIMARQAFYYSIALLAGLLALAMLNLSVYMYLSTRFGNGMAALLVAAANAVVAIIVIMVAGRVQPGPEAQTVKEMRDLAAAEVSADVQAVKEDFNQITADVKRIRSGFGALAGGDITQLAFSNLAPLLGLLINALKGGRKRSKK